MFIALYEFKVKPGFENQFEKSWNSVTEAIYKICGSLGSRLHKSLDGTYVAYAQWPSQELYEKEVVFPEDVSKARTLMKEACEDIKTLKLMNVCHDLLKN